MKTFCGHLVAWSDGFLCHVQSTSVVSNMSCKFLDVINLINDDINPRRMREIQHNNNPQHTYFHANKYTEPFHVLIRARAGKNVFLSGTVNEQVQINKVFS